MNNGIPVALLDSLRGSKGFDEEAFCEVHESGESYPCIRINPFKIKDLNNSDSTLARWQIEEEAVPWCEWGRWLKQRPSFILDPFWHAGGYYVQESSSMFLLHAIKSLFPKAGDEELRILDLCAAPGGKSSLLASYFESQLIVSNEIIQSRVNILAENITRWGSANLLVTKNDPLDFRKLNAFFDLMVVDAPCSGSGLFRKDNLAIEEWSPGHVKLCSQRQQRILHDILPALSENGILVYSTCSYSKEENEDILDWLVKNQELESLPLMINEKWGVVETQSDQVGAWGYRFYPDKTRGEGFFLACLRKIKKEGHVIKKVKRSEKLAKGQVELLRNWIQEPENLCYFIKGEWLVALPANLEEDYLFLGQNLKIRKGGILLGKLGRRELVPDHELAMSRLLNPSLPFKNLSLDMALLYLRKEIFEPEMAARGWALLGYEGLKLGWIKVLDRRINNYYPSSWRILRA